MSDTQDEKANRIPQGTSKQYKDTLFRTLFGDEENFLEMYNAVADDHIPKGTAVTPCQTSSLLSRFNDLAFRIGEQLVVFCEHQSTINPNMPVRILRYITDILYSSIVDIDELYRSTQVKIPAPLIFVLYNGEKHLGSRVLRLSDAYMKADAANAKPDAEPALELTAKVVDINYGSGAPALERSPSLSGYSYLIAVIRKNIQSGMTRDEAIVAAIDLCIKEGVLTEFLRAHYQEVIKMLNYEYDAEAERRVLREEARQEVAAEKDAVLEEERAKWQYIMADKNATIADNEATIADKDAIIADKDAIIADLQRRIGQAKRGG